MTRVNPNIVALTESVVGGAPFKIGDVVKHPTGKMVKIISGQYWGKYGISNFWYWREVKESGGLGKEECGYGWRQLVREPKFVMVMLDGEPTIHATSVHGNYDDTLCGIDANDNVGHEGMYPAAEGAKITCMDCIRLIKYCRKYGNADLRSEK